MKTASVIKSAFILTAANIITRLLGFFYRVYMADTIGAQGLGLYQLILPVYMLIWSITSSGFSTAISRLTSSEAASGRSPAGILKCAVSLSVPLSIILSVTVYFKADFIAAELLNDYRTALSLHLIAFCFPFMAIGSCVRGYFFGLQNAMPPAASQVLEQITRMLVIFAVASYLIPKGIPYACAAAVTGICIGEITSCIYVCLNLFSQKQYLPKHSSKPLYPTYGILLAMAVPLTLNRMTSSLLSAMENILIPVRLTLYGISYNTAIAEYGRLTGMAIPLLMFPSSFLTAVSTSIVPALSAASALKRHKAALYTIKKSMLLSVVTGFGTAALFIALPAEISQIIYGTKAIAPYLFMLGFICPFMYINVLLGGILNGLGQQMSIFINNLAGSGICLLFVWFGIPRYGINGYITGILISTAVSCCLNLIKISKKTGFYPNAITYILKPLFSASAAAAITVKFNSLAAGRLPQSISTLLSAAVLAAAFFILLLVTNTITVEDAAYALPKRLKKN